MSIKGLDQKAFKAQQKNKHHHHHHEKKKKMKLGVKIALGVAGALVLTVGVVVSVWLYRSSIGRKQLEAKKAMLIPTYNTAPGDDNPSRSMDTDSTEILDDGTIKYKGNKYKYNTDIITYLVMGIDEFEAFDQEAEYTHSKQADMLLLLVIDQKKSKITPIAVNRNTMTQIAIYDELGQFDHFQEEQIALSHSYGDGKEESAKLTCDATSKLFRNMPIHGYVAFSIAGVPVLNDAFGGVTLPLKTDFTDLDPSFVEGANVTLYGENAMKYVQSRYGREDETNESRMARQKQYLLALYGQLKETFKSNTAGFITNLPNVYSAVTPYMISNITLDEMINLAPDLFSYGFSNDSFKTLKGEVGQGSVYAEFKVDEDSLYELIIDTFYDKVS